MNKEIILGQAVCQGRRNGSVKYSSWTKSSLLLVLVNKVLLEHLLTYCDFQHFCVIITELNAYGRNHVVHHT